MTLSPTNSNSSNSNAIYLDNNSTTFPLPSVVETLLQCHQQGFANPASQHRFGRTARQRIQQAIQTMAPILGLARQGHRLDRIIFTSGGTESNNLAIRGLVGQPPGRVLISAVEHPSVLAAAESLGERGFELSLIPVNSEGVVDLDVFRQLIDPSVKLVSVMLGNNETGTLQPVAKIAEICRQNNILVHTDAVQAVGKVPVDFSGLGVQALSLTAHKFHGPRGIGALLLQSPLKIDPLLLGGNQQFGSRPGTESVALICGLCEALESFAKESDERTSRLRALRDAFESQLLARVPGIEILSQSVERLPHTSNIAFLGSDRQALLMALDRAGVACSTGAACVSGSSEPSHVLAAMNCTQEVLDSALRFSFSCLNTEAEIKQAVDKISTAILAKKPL